MNPQKTSQEIKYNICCLTVGCEGKIELFLPKFAPLKVLPSARVKTTCPLCHCRIIYWRRNESRKPHKPPVLEEWGPSRRQALYIAWPNPPIKEVGAECQVVRTNCFLCRALIELKPLPNRKRTLFRCTSCGYQFSYWQSRYRDRIIFKIPEPFIQEKRCIAPPFEKPRPAWESPEYKVPDVGLPP